MRPDILLPYQYKRQYAKPIDIDLVFETTIARNSYLTNARRYAGQIVADNEDGKTYRLNIARTAWIQLLDENSVTLPSQAGNSGKWLQTNGTVASWQNLPDFILTSQKGVASGVAPLNASSKIDEIYLPDSILGQVEYQTLWNATTNTPAIPAAAIGNKGHYYIVSVAGSTSIDGITDWKIGDWIISDGTAWSKVDNTDAISSFNTRTGAITLTSTDVTDALGFTPVTNARTLTINGSTYDLTANRSWTVEALPDQTTHAGKFLQTNGTVASWQVVIGALLTGYVSGAGTVSAADSILTAIQKLNGNVDANTTAIGTIQVGNNLFNYYNFI